VEPEAGAPEETHKKAAGKEQPAGEMIYFALDLAFVA
jgi:hypothetical protein